MYSSTRISFHSKLSPRFCLLHKDGFLEKMVHPPNLFHLFLVFSKKHYNFTTKQCEKSPSSNRCWDLNPQPSEHESPPITTRPGLLPWTKSLFNILKISNFEKWTLTFTTSESQQSDEACQIWKVHFSSFHFEIVVRSRNRHFRQIKNWTIHRRFWFAQKNW